MTASSRRKLDDHHDSGLKGIQEVAKEVGITMRALRFYEDKGLIGPQRVGTTRIYGRREVARIKLVLRGRRLGFSVREIKEFLDLYDADPEHVEQRRRFTLRVRERLDELEQRKAALDETIEELRALEREALAALAHAQGLKPA
ncbi:MerR family transcriptional regulator [Sphingomonas crusticola]|uniref:MerR family transcriptional regulator n=1 Tax=Sphingomonas crusticola TaxID=1697973 RepID=UPI000E246D86|nr:MerR family DNA-binding transcriptional regulator [Sphingomonas crusticola]